MIVRAALRGRELEVVRVEADRGRLRLPDPVLLRRERDQLRPRRARLGRGDRASCSSSSASSWSSAASRRCSSTAACSTPATGPRSPSSAPPSCRSWSRSRPSRSRPARCVLDRGRAGRRGDALDPDLPVRRHGAAPGRPGDEREPEPELSPGPRRPARPLDLRAPALGREPALARGGASPWSAGGACAGAAPRRSAPQPLDRELAVASLAAGVLGDRGDPGPEAGPQAPLLLVVEAREASISNTASIREAVTFACWPPGPDERTPAARSRSGIRATPRHRVADVRRPQ